MAGDPEICSEPVVQSGAFPDRRTSQASRADRAFREECLRSKRRHRRCAARRRENRGEALCRPLVRSPRGHRLLRGACLSSPLARSNHSPLTAHAAQCSKPVGEAPVSAVPLNRRTESAAPNKLAARGWKQKTPTIVPPSREDGAGPIFPRFPRIVARSSWVAFAQLSTQ